MTFTRYFFVFFFGTGEIFLNIDDNDVFTKIYRALVFLAVIKEG